MEEGIKYGHLLSQHGSNMYPKWTRMVQSLSYNYTKHETRARTWVCCEAHVLRPPITPDVVGGGGKRTEMQQSASARGKGESTVVRRRMDSD